MRQGQTKEQRMKDIEDFMHRNPKVVMWNEELRKRNETTAYSYFSIFYRYAKWLKKEKGFSNTEELLKDHTENRKQGNEYSHNDLLKEYLNKKHGNMSKSGKNQIVASVKSFYLKNRVPLGRERWSLKTKHDKVQRMKKLSTKSMNYEEAQQLIQQLKIREKAICMIMLQSCMGSKEFIEFNECNCEGEYVRENGHYCQSVSVMQQLNAGKDLIKINFPSRKTNPKPYYTFITKDAINVLKSYLVFRKQLVLSRQKRLKDLENKNGLKKDEKQALNNLRIRLQEITPEWQQGQQIFLSNLLNPYEVAELRRRVKVTKKHLGFGDRKFTPHNFRDIFRTLCHHVGVEKDIAEFFMGHSLDSYGYDRLAEMYPEDIEKEYLKVASELNFISNTKVSRERVQKLQTQVERSTTQVRELSTTVSKREDVIDVLIENGKHKEEKIDELDKQIRQMEVMYSNIFLNLIDQLPKEKREKMKEFSEVLKSKVKG